MFIIRYSAQNFPVCLQRRSRLGLRKWVHLNRRCQSFTLQRALTICIRRHQEDARVAQKDETPLMRSHIRYVHAENGTHGTYRSPPLKRPIGVESLGEPAEVLVMQKTPKATRNLGVIFTEEPAESLPPTLEGSPEALLHGINIARGIVDIDHVCANIDNVRDSFLESQERKKRNLSSEDYDELVSKLLAGFEKKHLAEYWRRSCSSLVVDALNLFFPYSSILLARTEWYTGAPSNRQASAPPLMGISPSKQVKSSFSDKGKRSYAEDIVRKCWGLQNDRDETPGEVVIRLPQTYLKLLLENANEPLKELSQRYSVKFEVNKKKGVIHIETDFSTSKDVLREITHILDRIKSVCISLEADSPNLPAKRLDDGYIKGIEQLTNTVIVKPVNQGRGTTNNEYIVHYLGPEESDLDDVRRLLTNGASAKITNRKGDIWIKVPVHPTTSAIPKEFGESLPLIARSTQWARFVDEFGRRFDTEVRAESSPAERPLDAFSDSDLVVDEVFRFLSHRGKAKRFHMNDTHQHWEPNLTRWSQVILGQVAFPVHQARKLEAQLKIAKTNADIALSGVQKDIARLERAFATTLPGMTRALEAASLSLLPVERLQIRMVPSSAPGLSPKLLNLIPELEILVRVYLRDKTIKLQTARLVLVHEELDLLLPSATTDLRLMRREYLYCKQKEMDQFDQQPSDPRLSAFIEASQLNIWGSQRLRTPNHLHLSIPASSISVSGGDLSLPDDSVIPVDYKFASLEHRSFVSLAPIGPYTPEYNTIQAGKTGGRREELAIRLGRQVGLGNRPLDVERDTAKGLLEAALKIISSMR